MPKDHTQLRIDIKQWLKDIGENRYWLADKCESAKSTVDQWLSNSARPIPQKAETIIRMLMADYWEAKEQASHENSMSEAVATYHTNKQEAADLGKGLLKFNEEEWRLIDEASGNEDSKEWIVSRIRDFLSVLKQPSPQNQEPSLMAAAGNGIEADVVDWNDGASHINVKLYGLSMLPRFNDGQTLRLRLKRTARSPYMKKGLFYLVRGADGFKFKKFNTRPATSEEIENEVDCVYISPIDQMPKVRVLESLNPEFPEIIVRDAEEWVAWFDKDDC